MTLNEYQEQAMGTCMPESKNVSYMLLGLNEEVGELSGKFAKLIRKGKLTINDNHVTWNMTEEELEECEDLIIKEIGDVLWMLSGLCSVMELPLNDIASDNLKKLSDRKQRGTIVGEGDVR